MSRKIYDVVVDKISLLFGVQPAVESAETKKPLLKMKKQKIPESIQKRLAEIIAKNSEEKN